MTVGSREPTAFDRQQDTEPASGPGGPDSIEAVSLAEETAHVTKRDVVTGRVRVRTVVDATEQLVREELSAEQVTVERVPIDRFVETAPPVRTEGDVTIIPVFEEILVVETKLLLKEEIRIHRTSTSEVVEQTVVLRKQRAQIETEGSGSG